MARPGRHAGRLGGRAALAAAVVLAVVRCWRGRPVGFVRLAGPRPRAPCAAVAAAAGEASEDAAWREAYALEVERNGLLRDQLQSQGLKSLLLDPEAPAPLAEPDACAVDWEQNYQQLAECNRALEAELRGQSAAAAQAQASAEAAAAAPAMAAGAGPARLSVPLAEQGTSETVELSRFFGGGGAFYAVQVRLPLGLNITKREDGSLRGAFVVEDVLPGGSAEANGEVRPGDVLQALTVVVDNVDMGMRTEDFVSSVVGGMGRYRQGLSDATFIDSAEELVDAIRSNAMLSSDAQLTLVFERDVSASPAPARPLEPLAAA